MLESNSSCVKCEHGRSETLGAEETKGRIESKTKSEQGSSKRKQRTTAQIEVQGRTLGVNTTESKQPTCG